MMTDKTMIHNYLDDNYGFMLNRLDVIDVSSQISGLEIVDKKYLDRRINLHKLKNEIIMLYGNFITDCELTIGEIVGEWYSNKIDELFKPIIKTLEDVEIVLGVRSWEVMKNGKEFDLNELFEAHKNDYPKHVIKNFFEEWKYNKIMEVSEGMLNS